MVYEDMTYEAIITRMIERITGEYPEVDIREGSMVFNAVASAAMELAIMYDEMENVLNESFVETATREYILLGCEQMGIDTSIFNASNGVFKGVFNIPVELDSRWNHGLYNYVVIEQMESEDDLYVYRLQCEMSGSEPNTALGDLTPIGDVNGDLTIAKITECLIEGEEPTPDDEIREYYFNHVRGTAIDGNVAQYETWCTEYDGIGNFRVIPQWNGPNTVKTSILSVSNRAASEELIEAFQNYLDPEISGMGDGVAPIGAFVTVCTATEVPITISGEVKLKDGYSDTSKIDEKLTEFFANMAYERSVVAYMNIGAAILDAEGVDFVTNITVNGGTEDITLGAEEIAVLGTTNWTVTT